MATSASTNPLPATHDAPNDRRDADSPATDRVPDRRVFGYHEGCARRVIWRPRDHEHLGEKEDGHQVDDGQYGHRNCENGDRPSQPDHLSVEGDHPLV